MKPDPRQDVSRTDAPESEVLIGLQDALRLGPALPNELYPQPGDASEPLYETWSALGARVEHGVAAADVDDDGVNALLLVAEADSM